MNLMKPLAAALAAAALLAVPAATAAAADTRTVWKDRTLLRIDGGECEADGRLSATYNVWIVPTLIRDGRAWTPGENVEIRTLISRGGQPCT